MAAPAAFNITSTKFDVSSWASVILSAHANLTQYAPSIKDLLLAGPRVGMKIGSFFFQIPESIDSVLAGRPGLRVIPEATAIGGMDASTTAAALGGVAQAGADALGGGNDAATGLGSRLSMESGRSFGNIFSYVTSRWSLGCIIMAIVLNRTFVYASTRRGLILGFKTRILLRAIPILLFTIQARWLLQSIQCQTSSDFGLLRWGNATKSSEILFTRSGGPLNTISSSLLFGASDEESCRAVRMVPPIDAFSPSEEINSPVLDPSNTIDISGSLSLLWPLFKTFCFSQFIETLSCAIQGRPVAAETGMTLFEHSLAFAEADAAVSSSLGLGPFGGTRHAGKHTDTTTSSETAIKRSMIMKRVNTPPEVLLVGFLSSMNHITSHLLGIFGLQARFRLASTAFWGLCFMSTITWSILNFSIDGDLANQSLLMFPTVCIIGFIPHVLVLAGIILCSIIYGLALVLTAVTPTIEHQQQSQSFLERLRSAHENMQANVPLSHIRVNMRMDFYTALLKTGFSALTIASEAVYLNETSEVHIKQRTWLEDERLREIEESGVRWLGPTFASGVDDLADGLGLVTAKDKSSKITNSSGYARERIAQKAGKTKATDRVIRDGVGATERSGRWIMAFEFFAGTWKLVIHWCATLTLAALAQLGITARPRWLRWLVARSKNETINTDEILEPEPATLDFWMLDKGGELVLPSDEHVDVEFEMRKRLKGTRVWSGDDERNLDSNLYGWWLSGGWWGGDDGSGTFNPTGDVDDDTTSMVSMSSSASEQDWESDDGDENDDGRRTPTQQSPHFSRDTSPLLDTPLSSTDLARLLHPKTPEQRAEAQALAAHLASETIVTRSRYQELHQRSRTKVLTSTRQRPAGLRGINAAKLSPDEETEILEYLITSRRAFHTATSSPSGTPSTWSEGASGMGEGGPQCVVCQSAPRSIIVWPCRCLCLCDDCRVTLAMNNFDKCVCCRRDVGSFSRMYVP